MGAVVGHGESLGRSLALVVDGARANRIDISPVALWLRMDKRVAVDLGGRGEQKNRVLGAGQSQHVVGPQRADLERRDWVVRVVNR